MHDDALPPEQRRALFALKPPGDRGSPLDAAPGVPVASLTVPVASLEDIAAMKVEAIASRGARKDFVDLYLICQQGLGLKGALDAFEARFASAHPDLLHRVKALTYFDDAEREPDLTMLLPVAWQDVRGFFEREARALWVEGGPAG